MDKKKSLLQQVAKGGAWGTGFKIFQKSFGIIRMIILARLLSPYDFGVIGITSLTMFFLDTFSNMGFQTALIQKSNKINDYLDTAWTFTVVRGFVLYILLYSSAPYISVFFSSPQTSLILRVVGISLILQGFNNVGVVYLQKDLEFKKYFTFQSFEVLSDFFISIILAIILKNVWALVFGIIIGHLIKCVLSYKIQNYKPSFVFEKSKFKELFIFGKWMLGNSTLSYLITQGDDIFVGRFLGTVSLGFYQLAYRISNLPTTEITYLISEVTLPAFSKLQDNLPKLKEAYIKILQLTAFISFPISALIFALAPNFILIFIGEKWMPMVLTMQILAWAGLIRSLTFGHLFYAVGKPEITTRILLIRLLVIVVLIFPFTVKWGIVGASVVVLISIITLKIPYTYMIMKILNIEIKKYSKGIIFPLINTFIMIIFIYTFKCFIIGFFSFLLIAFLSILIYLISTYICDKYFNYNIKSIIYEIFNSLEFDKI